MNELALFAGAGGGILGGKLLGWRTVCAVEIEEYCQNVLMQRQNDGILEPFPIWDDVRTFDGKPWRGIVDVVSGGFPCQDISCAGKGAGIYGERSGLWFQMARIVGEVRPKFVFVENSPMLLVRGIDRVLGSLAEMGYDARWGVVGAWNAGAPHKRDRVWVVGKSMRGGRGGKPRGRTREKPADGYSRLEEIKVPDADEKRLERQRLFARKEKISEFRNRCSWWSFDPAEFPHSEKKRRGETGSRQRRPAERPAWTSERPVESFVGRVAYGVADRVDRLKAIGNGQVPAVAALAWKILTEGIVE